MKRLCVLLAVLFVGLGCASEADKSQWDAFWKDARGDNMRMRSDFSGAAGFDDHSSQPKSHD
jgi:hypothetical protein